MGAMKDYAMQLAEERGVHLYDITNEDIQNDFLMKAQKAFSDINTSQEELERWKEFLPSKTLKDISYLGKVGDVFMDGNGIYYVIR